jgi:hypothetical protein
MKLKERKKNYFRSEDVRILRECLSWVHKKSPALVQIKTLEALQRFAQRVRPYCVCEEISYVALEDKYACLDCGKRHAKEDIEDDG